MLDPTLRDRARAVLKASRRSAVQPIMVMDEMAAAAPKTAIAAARAALDDGRIDFTAALGIPSLRARIARLYRETYRCTVDAERIVVTTGSSGGFVLAFLALFE